MQHERKRVSAGVVILRDTSEGWRFLLLRAFDYWDFPKGLVEEGETPLEAAAREVEEETTISDLDFIWGKLFTETGPYSRGKIARYYIARTQTTKIHLPVNPLLGRPEHSEYRWVSYEDALDLTSPRVHSVINWAANVLGLKSGES